MKDHKMKNRSPSGSADAGGGAGAVSGGQGKHDAKLRQKKHTSTTIWWKETAPGKKPDTYTRPKEQVGGGNATGSGPGPRVA